MCVYHYDVYIVSVGKDGKCEKSIITKGLSSKEAKQKDIPVVEHQQKRNLGKAKCRQIVASLVKSHALQKFCPVYDGQRNIFTKVELTFKNEISIDVQTELEDEVKTFRITIKPAINESNNNVISLKPLKELYCGRSKEVPQIALLVFDTIMNHREPPLTQIHLRNSFFDLQQTGSQNLDYGLKICFGYNQSVRLMEKSPAVVVNLTAKAFHKSISVIEYACEILKTDIRALSMLDEFQIKELTDALTTVCVRVTHQRQPRRYKIIKVCHLPAQQQNLDSDEKKSVAQYFAERYGALRYPQLPCLELESRRNKNYMPMENCEIIEGQPKVGELKDDLKRRMIRSTAVPPVQRFRSIMDYSKTIENVSGTVMNDFEINMDAQCMSLNGRVIAAPDLAYAGTRSLQIAKPDRRGVWKIETGKKFYEAKENKKWILISFSTYSDYRYEKLERFSQFLVDSSHKCGMKLRHPFEIKIFDLNISTEDAILYAFERDVAFAVIVLSGTKKSRNVTYRHIRRYEEIKFFADFQYGLVTQCIDDKNLEKINDQIATNICLKLNVKLGGTNHVISQNLEVFSRPFIAFGADVIHWPRGFGYPSIASVVGSFDTKASKYALTCRLQENKKESKVSQEIIVHMKDMVKAILETFNKKHKNQVRPQKLIFFRDGVSEGQFKSALEEEVGSIYDACDEVYHEIIPVTYIVVQKRHQTRIRPQDPKDGVGRMGNVPPGTTVDTTITHPIYFDFFLCSHEGIQGTSKPAHYTVLHDDNNFTAKDFQKLCHFLCHIYAHCTRSVSIPAPVLYADLAAARAKAYADLFIDPHSENGQSSKTQKTLPPIVIKAIESMQYFENMFYV
ncbi:LOW QUALITY PROTEIN: protein argonaute-4-like [Stegodyphus dumicola]|uniref:LOW QUALITY PROTEIN: protein argonaute-4-like n=1 Tax=Stegodyphus dumicola TaxID=202533 RepID=UPI0015B215A7|nr:LOW QUALITY PROTEIN: protein argonaute-4-like [Stegodyphus dumicola]